MLKKCLRYDLKSVFTYWIFGAIAMLILSIPGGLALRSLTLNADNPEHFKWEVFIIMLVYFVGVAFVILSEILVYVRYYKHFFSDEGYLTFTLPVKRRVLFTSKVINGFVWQIATLATIFISIIIMLCFMPPSNPDTSVPEYTGQVISAGWAFVYALEGLLIFALVSLVSVLFMYLLISIGANIVRKNKIIVTIGIAYGASIVLSILSYVLVLVGVFYGIAIDEIFAVGPSNTYLFIFLLLLLAIAVLFTISVALAFASLRIIERKLNLA